MADEKIYTIPLGKAFDYIRTKRARRAVSIVQAFVSRHSKVANDKVRVSNALNSVLWARGIQKPPRRVKVKIVKEEGMAEAYLVDEKIVKPAPKKEEKAEAKEEAKPEAKAEAPKAAEAKPKEAKAKPAAPKADAPAEAKK